MSLNATEKNPLINSKNLYLYTKKLAFSFGNTQTTLKILLIVQNRQMAKEEIFNYYEVILSFLGYFIAYGTHK